MTTHVPLFSEMALGQTPRCVLVALEVATCVALPAEPTWHVQQLWNMEGLELGSQLQGLKGL